MTAADPAVALAPLTKEEREHVYQLIPAECFGLFVLVTRMDAELTALRARVGEVERNNPLVIEREDALALRNLLGAARRGLAWASVINRAEVVIERLLAERERKEHP